MKDVYISALGKISLSEAEKDKAKALYGMEEEHVNEGSHCLQHSDLHRKSVMGRGCPGKENNMRVRKWIKPAVALAACLVLVVAACAVAPMLSGDGSQEDRSETAEKKEENKEEEGKKGIGDYIGNYFSVTAYAKELTETGKVYPEDYSVDGFNFGGAEDGGISFAFAFPVECKGKNIDTVTYGIKNGVFQIARPKGDCIVTGGEKVDSMLNVPGTTPKGVKKVQEEQYKSFSVKYGRQSDEKTLVSIADTSDAWSSERKAMFRKSGYSFDTIYDDGKADLEACNFLVEDLGITCTVTYKNGSTETKNIKVSSDTVKYGDVWDHVPEENQDDEMIVTCYSLE